MDTQLLNIPTELIYIIVENLPYIEDLLNFAICNKRCYSVVHSHLSVRCKMFKYDDYVLYLRKNYDVYNECFKQYSECYWEVDYYGYYLSDSKFLLEIQNDINIGDFIPSIIYKGNYNFVKAINEAIISFYVVFDDAIFLTAILEVPSDARKPIVRLLYSKLKYDDINIATDDEVPEWADGLCIMVAKYMITVLSDDDRKFIVTGT